MLGMYSVRTCSAAWLLTVSIMLLHTAAAPPPLELAKWNKAYKLSVSNLDKRLNTTYNLIGPTCSKYGYNSNAAAAPLESCFYKQNVDGTYSKWTKKPGDWRVNSNCYCYALNVYKGGFCIPGFHAESVMSALEAGAPKSCELMTQGLLADGAEQVSRALALSTDQPSVGHYIGLLVRKRGCTPSHCWNDDFHLVRRDADGHWSWKEPGGPAQALDVHGQPVSDPENSTIPGHYDIWCGYFLVNPARMKIGGNFGYEYSLRQQVDFLKTVPGVTVSLHATPYNHTVDGAPDQTTAKWLAQNAEWQSKRGTKEWNDFYAQQTASESGGYNEHYSIQRQNAGPVLPEDKAAPTAAQSAQPGTTGDPNIPAAPATSQGSGHQHDSSAKSPGPAKMDSSGAASSSNADGKHRPNKRTGSGDKKESPAGGTHSTISGRLNPAAQNSTASSKAASGASTDAPSRSGVHAKQAAANPAEPCKAAAGAPSKEKQLPASPKSGALAAKPNASNAPPAKAVSKDSRGTSPSNLQSPEPSTDTALAPNKIATLTVGPVSVTLPHWGWLLRLAHTEDNPASGLAPGKEPSSVAVKNAASSGGDRNGRRMLAGMGKRHTGLRLLK